MIFRSLKIAGFKSFAESAEVDIETGLTGIVGPNGCGKSNIVEGLRWVMGESNARQMRGGEMDDVIFAGTDTRPARNLAEITLQLDNSDRSAPSEFNNDDDLEITRKIERGKGSSYFVNTRPARAKDVQLLFADSATGARSSGIVSQGRIGAIVGARPTDRRALLEEAANIRGLHARRHEAELRLKGAETNLERLDDVVAGLIEQRDSLKKQARQAARYRSVADRIRKAEAQLLLARWYAAEQALADAAETLRTLQLTTADHTQIAASHATTRAELAAKLPPLRETEVARAAEYQRLAISRDELDREEARIRDALERAKDQQHRITEDIEREASLRTDASSAIDRLTAETAGLRTTIDEAAPQQENAASELATIRAEQDIADSALADAAGRVRAAESTRTALSGRITDLRSRQDAARAALDAISLAELQQAAGTAHSDLEAAEARNAADVARLTQAESALADAQNAAESAATIYRESDTRMTRLQAEIDALGYLLAAGDGSGDVPIADSLTVLDSMEQALTACLSEELSAPAGSGDVSYWRSAGAQHDLETPEGTRPLADSVIGAPELASTLAGIGVVDTPGQAQFLQDSLRPGQSVTTQQGGLWRWDGFVRRPGAQDSGAERIRQRQRLETLEAELAKAATEQNRLSASASTADQALAEARTSQTGARADAAESNTSLSTARRAEESTKLRLSAAEERADELRTTAATLGDDLASAEAEAAALGDDAALQKGEADARQVAEAVRTRVAEAMQAESRFAEAVRVASDRLTSAATETEAWQKRLAGAENRVGEMKTRLAEGEAEIERLSAMPDALAKQRDALADTLQTAETVRQQAADDLRRAETELAAAETAQREADTTLAASREQLVRAEGTRDFATETRRVVEEQISDKLDCSPDGLASIADIEDATSLPEVTVLEDRVHRLIRERDTIGPVNLRAETEMEEVAARIESIEAEQEDLVAAIEKLRAAISRLNRQGREQLLNSFAAVNNHFKDLFKVLFGGGTAELQLTESADPLEAGLEILAQPPGKRLQSLSLLSGGEQALTALAIIFAVFLTNPAPICVLDEVDAPLDDTNVARFCDLLRDIAGKTDTRFMVITHHRMTMARMDRLFGVTMEQRGISKLVSVDLQTAERIRDAAVA